ncbi:MAG: protein translocase subunit SecF [Clostridia bacterium]|nr:protein translocase subunit SecF [Clostridia bacterium]
MKFKMDYVKHKNVIFIISLAVVLAGIIYGVVTGYKFDIDFKGGTRIQVDLNEEYSTSDIEKIVSQITNQVPDIQTTSSGNNSVSITTQIISEEMADTVVTALNDKYTNMGEATVKNVQASYGKELLNSAVVAVVVSIVLLLVYVGIRFKTLGYTAALSAVLALMFDVAFLFAIYGIFKFPINSTFVAVVLTIIGYSINDTIIVYDRIRENKRLVTKSNDAKEVINNSINQTMKRTIITSLTTLASIGVVLVFAIVKDQETLKQFSIPLVIGVAEGTYSSIFIASNLWYTIDKFVKKFKKA